MTVNRSKQVSLLAKDDEVTYKTMSDSACHDIGLDAIVKAVTSDPKEQQMIMRILSRMTPSEETAVYRRDVFEDILNLPDVREKLLELMNQIDYLKDYGSWRKNSDEKPGLWDLLHRLEELKSYITTVESLAECLGDPRIKAEGLTTLRDYVGELYEDGCFAAMKKDIEELKTDASSIQSVTIGINVNSKFEAESLGLVSVNAKPFKKSGIVSNFADAVAARDRINKDAAWDGDLHYDPADPPETDGMIDRLDKQLTTMSKLTHPMLGQEATLARVPEGDGTTNSTFYLSGVATKMTAHLVKRLRTVLSRYSDISIVTISKLIPELIYYIRFAEFIESATKRGMHFCRPEIAEDGSVIMQAEGLYNLKLASTLDSKDIVDNDLTFDGKRTIYLLTGANRGGKTTITQAAGQLFALAQGGIHVPCRSFVYKPADMIYTHFPADEDKTMDLGRLGEECVRFKDIYDQATPSSLILLNESFSTTSFEEGYYIAVDSVRALSTKGVRTIFNTHMHKLAADAGELGPNVSSIVMISDGGKRSFKVVESSPEGSSYARDIAEKYGVTYEMLTARS